MEHQKQNASTADKNDAYTQEYYEKLVKKYNVNIHNELVKQTKL